MITRFRDGGRDGSGVIVATASGLGRRDSNGTRALKSSSWPRCRRPQPPQTMSVRPSSHHHCSLPSRASRLMPSSWLPSMTISIAHRPRLCRHSRRLPYLLPLHLLLTGICSTRSQSLHRAPPRRRSPRSSRSRGGCRTPPPRGRGGGGGKCCRQF